MTSPQIISRTASRLNVMRRHLNALALNESVLFPTPQVELEEHVMMNTSYSIQVHVRHDEKIVDFVTEFMSPSEKRNVYLRQKRMMRELYPHYLITEKHK
tara:strand:- start:819 stop:1118 length:300 start_codon:yes stop_codon:yes gene_type:complete